MNLVAFTGLAGSGKSTASNALVEHHGFHRLSFATPLREMLLAFGLTADQLSSSKAVPIDWLDGKTPRQLLQTLGTEWGRERVHPDIWVKLARRKIEEVSKAWWCRGIVFDDCRFDNEAKMIAGAGGTIIGIKRQMKSAPMQHASEAGVSPDLVNTWIINDAKDRDAFESDVLSVVRKRQPNLELFESVGRGGVNGGS